jgi:hypothetical protein
MEYELTYANSRAIEEREAAATATCAEARASHLRLARVFEEHAERLRRLLAA